MITFNLCLSKEICVVCNHVCSWWLFITYNTKNKLRTANKSVAIMKGLEYLVLSKKEEHLWFNYSQVIKHRCK